MVTTTVTAVEFTSLDGVMQGLGSPDEDRDGGFEFGGWGAEYAPGIAEIGARGAADTQAYLFGRRTYEKMAAYWPDQPDTNPLAASLNALPKYVVSGTLRDPGWDHTVVLAGDPARSVAELKERVDGNIVILGSGVLVHALMCADLVDQFRLFVHPLLLGTGKRLFRDLPHPTTLRLTDIAATDLGTVAVSYIRVTRIN